MAAFTLDDIREAADKKYGSVEIEFGEGESVKFVNPLRLSKEDRGSLVKLQDELDAAFKDEDGDQVGLLQKGIVTVSDDKEAAAELLKLVGDDLAVLASLFETYTAGTQAGEA